MQRTTVTLEFFAKESNLYVIYNNKEMSIVEFFNTAQGPEIFKKLFDFLDTRHHSEMKNFIAKDWRETLIKYIIKHFPDKQDPLDVIIHSNGKITLNKER